MRKPKNRNTPISDDRFADWLGRFAAYREPPVRQDIDNWLDRFSERDRDMAARILDCTEIVSDRRIHDGYRDALNALPGWHRNSRHRTGRWFFVGFGGAGESGPAMLRPFRDANMLNSVNFDALFKTPPDLPKLALTALDNVVFVDDFAGTGNQICNNWDTIKELIGSDSNTYLILTAATETAQNRIRQETTAILTTSISLGDEDDVFSYRCTFFNSREKTSLLRYCKKADKKSPKGFGHCGLLFVLSHKTPNNTIPILHINGDRWRGLFPRYL